jgi:hypothetical protein
MTEIMKKMLTDKKARSAKTLKIKDTVLQPWAAIA